MRLWPALLTLALALLAGRVVQTDFHTHFHPLSFHMPSVPAALPPNQRLAPEQVERLFEGQIVAPEHYAFDQEGVHDGRIMRTRPDPATGQLSPLETIVYTGDAHLADRQHPCGSEESEAVCGRPLGMAFDATGKLIVADCYRGLLRIDVHTKHKEVLLQEVAGLPVYFANSVVVGPKSGRIYFTDSTQRWRRKDFIYEVLESQTTGRLIEYDPATKQARVLVEGVAFANGLLVDPLDEKYLLMIELNRARILRYDLEKGRKVDTVDWQQAQKEEKKGPVTVLVDNLPGIPDNLSWEAGSHTHFWAGCGTARRPPLSLTDLLAPFSWARTTLASLLPKAVFLRMVPRVGLVLRLEVVGSGTSQSASVVDSLQDPTGQLHLLTSAYEHQGYLYLGSISAQLNFVARVPWLEKNLTQSQPLN